MVRCIYNLIEEIIPTLSQAHIDVFFSKIKETPVSQFDEKFIYFLSNFTKVALKQKALTNTAHNLQKPEFAETANFSSNYIFEQTLLNREREIVRQMSRENLGD